jgi:hypothetical protein
MRLWSLHPRYLDSRALVALWREGLLAQAVMRGKTRGYRAHPQLLRFQECATPIPTLVQYLRSVQEEATRRGYSFDRTRLAPLRGKPSPLTVTAGQLAFELKHLRAKVTKRDRPWLPKVPTRGAAPHPSFRRVAGGIAGWERGADS